ncbi:MAG: isopentenyl phosphate kinase [Patescibacteria group bacterium]|jgi:isopentenyl phosphate kinase
MKPIIFVKIGGSLITDKLKANTLKKHALTVICEEIKLAMETGKQLIVGHGAGSFAHFPAKKYQTHKGIAGKESCKGIAEVADVAAQLNRIVVRKLIDTGVDAVSVSPLSTMTAKNHELNSICTQSLEEILKHNLLPVLYGDQIIDTEVGCTIFSTEKVLGYLALHLKEKGYPIERMIHCGQTNGVYDENGETIELINSDNFEQYKKALGGSGGVDVTGGMIHKVEETLALAQKGVPGLIIDGIENGSLSRAVRGEKVIGTRVEK